VTCILIVEDHDLNRDMLSRRLKRRGFQVVSAADGAAGVEAAVRERPDLVLMDMSLPVVDGWQATRMIKANPETSTIPVMALTAHALKEDRERALEAGCDEFETKPVDLDRLLNKIDVLLSRVRLVNSP
jgi:two-component system cell cycle response regulator DivK